ncbi:MAG: hypothetical protein ABJA70_15010 [Chryseolinea sp.]
MVFRKSDSDISDAIINVIFINITWIHPKTNDLMKCAQSIINESLGIISVGA